MTKSCDTSRKQVAQDTSPSRIYTPSILSFDSFLLHLSPHPLLGFVLLLYFFFPPTHSIIGCISCRSRGGPWGEPLAAPSDLRPGPVHSHHGTALSLPPTTLLLLCIRCVHGGHHARDVKVEKVRVRLGGEKPLDGLSAKLSTEGTYEEEIQSLYCDSILCS
jgi:hypothetical protein